MGLSGGLISSILSVSKELFELRGKLSAAKAERREAVATYLDKIATALNEAVTILRRGEKPTASSARLRAYAERLPDTIGDFIDRDDAEAMSFVLSSAFGSELTHLGSTLPETREQTIEDLERAVGYFQATADSVRASV